MLIALLIIATLLIVFWLILLCRACDEDWMLAAYVKIFDNHTAAEKLRQKDKQAKERLSGFSAMVLLFAKMVGYGVSEKRIGKLETEIEGLQNGKLKSLNALVMPGYVLQREIEAIGKGSIHKLIISIPIYALSYTERNMRQTKQSSCWQKCFHTR